MSYSKKSMLGFDKGMIYIFKGDQEQYNEWFKESPCRYHCTFGWYLVSEDFDKIVDYPIGIEPVELKYEDVFVDDNTLKPKAQIEARVFELLYGGSASQFRGTIGARLDLTLKCTYAKSQEGNFGSQTFHMFEDEDGNVFTWNTSAKTLEVGKIYKCRATIKDHKIFRGQKQTVLTRAMQFEEKESF